MKARKDKLQEMLRNLRSDIEQETLSHLEAKSNEQALKEEIEFLKSVYDQVNRKYLLPFTLFSLHSFAFFHLLFLFPESISIISAFNCIKGA